jgi:alpha-galactosidase
MTKITFVGAGSLVFTRNLCSDVLLSPALQDCTISLMDIDSERLWPSRDAVRSIVDRRGIKAHVEATTDREEALRDADYVVTTFQQGGLEAYEMDVQIPRRYGIEQCVGDTLGPGGVFRALRTIPVLLDLCREIEDLAPDALLLNYVNPMAANCWAVDLATGRPCVGLCHSVQDTSEMLAEWADVPYEEMIYFCAGINHQAFFLKLRRGGEDLYPRVKKTVGREEIRGREPVRIDIMENFGFFVTESSGHASEYMPYFRKNARMVEEELVPRFTDERNYWYDFGRTGGYLRHCLDRLE